MGLRGEDRAVLAVTANVAMALDVARSVTIWAANPGNGDAVSLWTKLALEAARARRSAEGAKARSRAAASKAKGLGTNLSLPPKLLPSRETGRGSGAELFLCEGDSALGTIKAARDATFQAAFPLKSADSAQRLRVHREQGAGQGRVRFDRTHPGLRGARQLRPRIMSL